MAQRRTRARVARGLARRFGFRGNQRALFALLAVACAATALGIAWHMQGQGFVIERSGRAPQASEAGADAQESVALDASPAALPDEQEDPRFIVHVDGAVAAPGVVELTGADMRVYDAVEAAGGLTADADTSSVNLAEPLADGSKIHIPAEGEEVAEQPALPGGQAQTSGATGGDTATVLVNINTATSEELQTLSGVGAVTAEAIIDERERNGPYASIEDLMRVTGIGEKKFEKVRDSICV